jgi:dUTP pyrophosphatase
MTGIKYDLPVGINGSGQLTDLLYSAKYTFFPPGQVPVFDNKIIKVKLLSNEAKAPTKANQDDAGWDLYSTQDVCIKPGHRQVVSTGIAIAIPPGYVGLIWPRSGLSVKNGCDILAGVIDAGYRGEIKVCIQNCDPTNDINLSKGAKIAQILFQEIPKFELLEVDELDETDRNDKGFGSSGV